MAGYDTGRWTIPSGTGNKTVITALSGAPTGCRITTVEGANQCTGTADGTTYNYICTGPAAASGTNRIILLHDSAGTVVAEGTWSSFSTSGGSGTVTVNMTTNSSNRPTIVEVWN